MMKKHFFLVLLILLSGDLLSQEIKNIKVEHIGESDKSFPIIYLCVKDFKLKKKNELITVSLKDNILLSKVLKYFESNFVGLQELINTEYGTFHVSFYGDKKLDKSLILLKKEEPVVKLGVSILMSLTIGAFFIPISSIVPLFF